jgi:hypothetical protein
VPFAKTCATFAGLERLYGDSRGRTQVPKVLSVRALGCNSLSHNAFDCGALANAVLLVTPFTYYLGSEKRVASETETG